MAQGNIAYTTDYAYYFSQENTVRARIAAPEKYRDAKKEVKKAKAPKALPKHIRANTFSLTHAQITKMVAAIILVGVLLIGVVGMNAKATEIKYSINKLNKANAALETDIAMLGIEIEGANSIESVEDYATGNLGMKYPTSSQCIYIDDNAQVTGSLASVIRDKAYNS